MKTTLPLSLALLLVASTASAQTNVPAVSCLDSAALRTPSNVVYVAGSSALRPFLTALAPILSADGYTIVYQSQGSCTGVAAVYEQTLALRQMKDIPAGAKPANYAIYFKSDGSAAECYLDTTGAGAGGTAWPTIDIGASDVFASSCGYTAPPTGVTIADYNGPIQPMTFVVPAASTQKSISAEAAYLAFGLGGGGGSNMAAPWVDPSLFFVRNASSGTQQMVSRAIGVPADKWWGLDRGGSGAVDNGLKLLVDANAEKAIGIVSVDIADAERANLRVLAFKSKGQSCGYLPDSTASSKDKLNVRDGHYPIWGPVHLLTRTTSGAPSATAGAFVSRFALPRIDESLLDAEITKGLVPLCAMRVSRKEEMGALMSSQPSYSCGCYFDLKANGATSCKACTAPGECPSATPACNFGYCEAGQ